MGMKVSKQDRKDIAQRQINDAEKQCEFNKENEDEVWRRQRSRDILDF